MSISSTDNTITRDTITLETADKQTLNVSYWSGSESENKPEHKPRAIVHILHGMAEHHLRYEELAGHMVQQGLAVYAYDHRGHGQSIGLSGTQGHYADSDGWQNIIGDVKTVQDHIQTQHQDLPIFILGHSMGSFIAQYYFVKHGNHLSGLMLTGTSYMTSLPIRVLNLVISLEKLRLGANKTSKLIHTASFGSFNKAFKPNRTEFDWLSRDTEQVDQYIADEQCGYMCTTATWYEFSKALIDISQLKNTRNVDKDIPILLLCGDKDPVGNFGKGVIALQNFWQKAKMKTVDLELIPDGRHEILNETNRSDIHQTLTNWIKPRLL